MRTDFCRLALPTLAEQRGHRNISSSHFHTAFAFCTSAPAPIPENCPLSAPTAFSALCPVKMITPLPTLITLFNNCPICQGSLPWFVPCWWAPESTFACPMKSICTIKSFFITRIPHRIPVSSTEATPLVALISRSIFVIYIVSVSHKESRTWSLFNASHFQLRYNVLYPPSPPSTRLRNFIGVISWVQH